MIEESRLKDLLMQPCAVEADRKRKSYILFERFIARYLRPK